MINAINTFIDAFMGSPWAWMAIFGVCALDAFLPVVPSETTVIAAGVLAAAGDQNLAWVIALAMVGAFVGDNVSYLLGRVLGTRVTARVLRGPRGHAAYERARRTLHNRGGLIIVAARFVPGGRTATTLAAGTVRYPLPRFAVFAAVAALLWAVYASLIGYWSGGLLEGNPLLAVAFGIGVSAALTVVVETGRFVWRRKGGRGGGRREARFQGTSPGPLGESARSR